MVAPTVQIVTPANNFRRGLVNSSTCTTFPTIALDVTTMPATIDSTSTALNQVVIPPGGNNVVLQVFGTDADDETINLRAYEVRPIDGLSFGYVLSFSCACIVGTHTGVAGGAVAATEFYADTIVTTAGAIGTRIETYSPTGNGKAEVVFDQKGCATLIVFDVGTAASANVLWAKL